MEERLILLMRILITQDIFSMNYLIEQLELSRRQVEYSISKLNDWLNSQGIDEVIKVPRKGYLISAESRNHIQRYLVESNEKNKRNYHLGKEERQHLLYLFLFLKNDYISLFHYSNLVKISSTTGWTDIQEKGKEISVLDVQIKNNKEVGYYLSGNEIDIRYLALKSLINLLENKKSFLTILSLLAKEKQIEFTNHYRFINHVLEKYNMYFTEAKREEFIYGLILLFLRIKNGNTLQQSKEFSIFYLMKEFELSQELLNSFSLDSDFERNYVTAWILGQSEGNYYEETCDREAILELVKGITFKFTSISGIKLDREEKFVADFYSHFRSSYYRLLFRLPTINALAEKIIEEYPLVYSFVEESIKPLSNTFSQKFSKDEISLMTMYFATLVIANRDNHSFKNKQLIAAVVCPNGIGTSKILTEELRALFPYVRFIETIETTDVETVNTEVDLYFSTTPINQNRINGHPCFVVSPIMNYSEKNNLVKNFNNHFKSEVSEFINLDELIEIIEKYSTINNRESLYFELSSKLNNHYKKKRSEAMLSDLTSEKLISLNVQAGNWRETIKLCGASLVTEKKVKEQYIDAMIHTAEEYGPYIVISKHVAMPHARAEDGVVETAISISTLKNPVVFGNEENDPVKYVFCLAAQDNSSHLTAMSELIELLELDGFYEMLESATDSKSVYKYIKNFEKEKEEIL